MLGAVRWRPVSTLVVGVATGGLLVAGAVASASVGGVGGCPFAPNATGNVGTEDLVYMLSRAGYDTGIDLNRLIETARWLGEQRGKPVPSMVSKAGGFPLRSVAASA